MSLHFENRKINRKGCKNSANLATSLIENFKQYDFTIVDTMPKTERELYNMYYSQTNPLHCLVKKITGDSPFVLTNEIRAVIGHLASYRESEPISKRELEKAYGHFRRYNIDILKIICDTLDQSSWIWLKTHYHYKYHKIKKGFLEDYVTKYQDAKTLYLKAQSEERVGSDSGYHNIFKEYYCAAKAYVDLYQFLNPYSEQISRAKFYERVRIALSVIGSVMGLTASLIGLIP